MVSPPSQPAYSMAEDAFRQPTNHKRRHRRGGSTPEDDTGSLTYSAASSVNSGGSSAAGESTDSSFGEIMRVLALQDGPELEALMKKEGFDPKIVAKARARLEDTQSVASSLNYSTDGGESLLHGDGVLTTITGQPSNSYGPDGGAGLVRETKQTGPMTENIVFSPADPVDRKKHRSSSDRTRSKGSKSSSSKSSSFSSADIQGSPKGERRRPSTAPKGTPPHAPPRRQSVNGTTEDCNDSLWYTKWWMCGFTDALRDLVPKR